MSHFEVYQEDSEKKEWRWRLVADNGEIVAQSESYTSQEDAERGTVDAQRAALKASTNG